MPRLVILVLPYEEFSLFDYKHKSFDKNINKKLNV